MEESLGVQWEATKVVKDASLSRWYLFLPASWAGDTHEETDVLPIGDREVKRERVTS